MSANPQRLDLFGAAIVAVLIGGPIALGAFFLYERFFAGRAILNPDLPPALSPLARRVQELDEASAVALAEEYLAGERYVDVHWADVRLAPQADPRVYLLKGAHAAFAVDKKRVSYAKDLCLLRGPEGWAVWEAGFACDAQPDWIQPGLPPAEREALLSASIKRVRTRTRAAELPKTCSDLDRVVHAQVGFIDTNLDWESPAGPRIGNVQLTSTVVNSCPAGWSPLLAAWGGCGLDVPWRYAVVFDLEGLGYDRATAIGGAMRGTIEVVDMKSGTVICERPLNFAQGEQAFNVRGEPRDPAAPENYRIRAYAAICAEIKALGGGKLPTHAWWRCAG